MKTTKKPATTRRQVGVTPRQSIDVDSEEYKKGAARRRDGGSKENKHGPGVGWVNWQAGYLGLTKE